MAYAAPTIADFKSEFVRDFPYSNNDTDVSKVMDQDIQRALDMAGINFNDALWESQLIYTKAFLLLSAHYLVDNLRASSQGVSSQYAGNTSSKSVGNVSESYAVPEKVMKNPALAGLYTTRYGAQYVGMISPRLVGHVMTVMGGSKP